MNRRDFLTRSGSLLAFLQFAGCSGLEKLNTSESGNEIAVFWHGTRPGADVLLPVFPSHIIFLNPQKNTYSTIEIPLTAHSIIQNESKPELLYFFSKWSKEVAIYNKDKQKVTRILTRPDHIRVYGHGVWDASRKGMWFTEQNLRDRKGYLTFCDENLNVQTMVATGGGNPHEVRIRDGQFLVANSIGANNLMPSMSFIDVKSTKLVNKIEIPDLEYKGTITHMCLSKNDKRIFVGGERTDNGNSVIVEISNDEKSSLVQLDGHPLFKGESFSLYHDPEKEHLSWVNPFSGGLFTWDLKNKKLDNVMTDKYYNGLQEYDNALFLATKEDSSIHRNQKRIISVKPPAKGSWGVHMQVLKKVT